MFVSGCYPAAWAYARLNMFFKKGSPLCCDNYRGISIINSICKIYDYILRNRLMKWYSPDREQAGAQPRWGCMEHIVTLRLIMNYCFRKRVKLFITYVDFSKAYDRVPMNKLLGCLRKLGCGLTMLLSILAMYQVTKSLLGMAVITAIVGVRQGSPTSCFLFTIFVNELIVMLIMRRADDGFLCWLHSLMLMHDTIILATTRERLQEKLDILHEFCISDGMVINEDKTKFIVIHGNTQDKRPMPLGDQWIKHCQKYVYLGVIFTSDDSSSSSLQEHANDKQKHLLTKACPSLQNVKWWKRRSMRQSCMGVRVG